jgi:hypothetical protein
MPTSGFEGGTDSRPRRPVQSGAGHPELPSEARIAELSALVRGRPTATPSLMPSPDFFIEVLLSLHVAKIEP